MALRSALGNYGRYKAPKPKAPRVASRVKQPTTGAGRVVRPPANPRVSMGTLRGMKQPTIRPPKTVASAAATAPGAVASSKLAPLVAGLPVDPVYDATVAAQARKRDDTIAGLTQQRTQGFQDYGYTPTLDATGGVKSLNFDPSNPYSRAALLKKNYEQGKQTSGTNMAARGQLYSGAYQTVADQADQGYGQNTDNLQKQLINFVARNTGQQTQARTGYEDAVSQAAADRVTRAADNPLYDPDALAALQAQIDQMDQTDLTAAAGPAGVSSKPKPIPAWKAPFGAGTHAPKPKPKPAPKRPAPRAPAKPKVSTKPKAKTRK